MGFIENYLRHKHSDDITFIVNANPLSIRRKMLSSLGELYGRAIISNDNAFLATLSETQLRHDLENFLASRGFLNVKTLESEEWLNTHASHVDIKLRPDIAFLGREHLVEGIINTVSITLCRPEFNYLSEDANVTAVISNEQNDIIRRNFTIASDLVKLSFQTGYQSNLWFKSQTGQIHAQFVSFDVMRPTDVQLGAIYTADPECHNSINNNIGAVIGTHEGYPEHVKFNPVLAALSLNLIGEKPTQGYFSIHHARHQYYGQNHLFYALQMTALRKFSYINPDAVVNTFKNKAAMAIMANALSDLVLNIEPEKLLNEHQKKQLLLIHQSSSFTELNTHYPNNKQFDVYQKPVGPNGFSDIEKPSVRDKFRTSSEIAHSEGGEEKILDKLTSELSDAIFEASRFLAAYDAIERICENSLLLIQSSDCKKAILHEISHGALDFIRGHEGFLDACAHRKFEALSNVALHCVEHNYATHITQIGMPHQIFTHIVNECNAEQRLLKRLYSSSIPNKNNKENCLVSDLHTDNLSSLIAAIELKHPGFIKEQNINLDKLFRSSDMLEAQGASMTLNKINQQKREALNDAGAGNEDIGFLSTNLTL